MASSAPLASGRQYELDLLRLCAALMVVAAHYFSGVTAHLRWHESLGRLYDYGALVERLSTLGLLGVDVFFIISGYVIAMSAKGRTAREFMASRFARILPAFWFCCVFTWLIIALDPGYRTVTLFQLIANLLFIAAPLKQQFVDAVYWSLVVEMRFYLMVALLILIGQYRNYSWWLFGWLTLSVLHLFHPLPGAVRFLLLPQFGFYFVLGGALFMIYERHQLRLAYLMFAVSTALVLTEAQRHLSGVRADLGYLPALVMAGAVVLLWMISTRHARFGSSWMPIAGMLTYPLYLLHEDLGFMFMRHVSISNSGLITTACAILLFLCSAYLVSVYVERPLSRWVRRILTPGFRSA